MLNWEYNKDRRRFVRFPVTISLRYCDLGAVKDMCGKTSDISAHGVGIVTEEVLAPGASVNIWLSMPDTGEQVLAKGRVIWSNSVETKLHRIGVCLEEADLKPIPLVLRTIQTTYRT